ncbi:hypothetical protein F53441_12955 [Fusarium austroafricanum]|uniref:Uncharacterized protein n=1 Tax=Fusarium austroafricanum TaxID=2364996 RepID=A0A8H4JVN5_9HYPO|nr:hypothetical protein F53441_12955 [Fusarium austroafricanum]
MSDSSPFEKLPSELKTMILRGLESPQDIQSFIRADSHMLSIFLEHRDHVLRPLRQDLCHPLTGKNLGLVMVACRLRQTEDEFKRLTRAQVAKKMQPIMKTLSQPLLTTGLSLGLLCALFQLLHELEFFTSSYSRQAWENMQNMADKEAEDDLNARLIVCKPRVPLLLSNKEKQHIQIAYLLFEAYRNTLAFNTSLLQQVELDHDIQDSILAPFEICCSDGPWEVRAFQLMTDLIIQSQSSWASILAQKMFLDNYKSGNLYREARMTISDLSPISAHKGFITY